MFSSNTESMTDGEQFISAEDLIAQHFQPEQAYALFLDIDGTISEFHVDPQQSYIPKHTLKVLENLQQHYPIIAVTGRSVSDAYRLFSPLDLAIAGTHGLEIQLSQQSDIQHPKHYLNFDDLYSDIEQACRDYPALLLERKKYAVAIHYRSQPDLEPHVKNIAQALLEKYSALKLNLGKCVVELILAQADKGQAIATLYTQLDLNGVTPIFIGDDVTDESGFKIINDLGGISIKIGSGATHAKYRFKSVQNTLRFIELFLAFFNKNKTRQSHVLTTDGEITCLN